MSKFSLYSFRSAKVNSKLFKEAMKGDLEHSTYIFSNFILHSITTVSSDFVCIETHFFYLRRTSVI